MAKEYVGKKTLAKLIAMIRSEFNKFPDPDKVATTDYVDEEIATFDFIKIVPELPETGLVNRTYFVPKSEAGSNDLYDEYMWINDDWEYRGSKQIEVDLTEYVKNTDYATQAKAGVAKVYDYGYHGLKMSNGILTIWDATTTEIDDRKTYKPITAKNLDYAIKSGLATNNQEWTEEEQQGARNTIGAIGATDYPDGADKAGAVKVNPSAYGVGVYPTTGYLYIASANNGEIDAKTNARRPIVPANLDYAIKVGLTANTQTLSDEEKAAACEWLGVNALVGDIETALDSIIAEQEAIIAIQNKLIGGDAS